MSEQKTQQLMASLKQNKEEITDTLESNRPWISGERKHENDRLYIISAILNIIQMLMVGHAALCPATQTKKMQTLERVFKQMQELNCACFAQFLATYQSRRTHQLLSAAGRNNYRGELRWIFTHLLTGEAQAEWLREFEGCLHKEPIPPTRGRMLAEDDCEEILGLLREERVEMGFRLIKEAGFRPHEVLSLHPCDILLANQETGEMLPLPSVLLQQESATGGAPGEMAAEPEEESPLDCTPMTIIIQLPDHNPVTSSGRNKTGGRVVPLMGQFAREFLCWIRTFLKQEAVGAQERLFPWANGYFSRTFTRLKKIFAQPRDKGGFGHPFPGRLYDFRHTAATTLSRRPISDQLLKRILGWSRSSKMAEVYIHLGPQDIAQWAYSVQQ